MSADRVCPACHHHNDATANFCSSCGERIGGGPEEPTAAIPIVAEPAAGTESTERSHLAEREGFGEAEGILLVESGPKSGSRYALDQDTISAGRHPESDIFLDDVTVSRRHVEITRDSGSYSARDVGSLNGTYVNKELVDEGVELSDGDVLQIGRFKLLFFHGTGTGD